MLVRCTRVYWLPRRFRDCDESVCLDSLVDGDIDVWDETGFFRFMNKKEIKLPMRVYATTLFSLAFTSVLFMVFVFSALTPVSNFLGYGAHPEYIGMMAGIVAVDAFCCIPFAFLRYQGRRFALRRSSC